MSGTEQFKNAIKTYLDERAKTDELFAVSYAKENKNIADCVTFVLNQVKAIAQEDCVGMTDEEVYSLATHYYDEDNIEVGKAVDCGVVVNHRVELTEQEKATARQNAMKQYQAEQLRHLQERSKPKKRAATTQKDAPEQLSLFDMAQE